MFTSEYAFGDTLTRNENQNLINCYKKANIKRFHYMNAGIKDLSYVSWFVSYYTYCIGLMYDERREEMYMFVQPFVYDVIDFVNSRTTNRQINRWLDEKGIIASVRGIRNAYRLLEAGNATNGFYTDDGIIVIPRFNHYQKHLLSNGTSEHTKINSVVPHVKFDYETNALVRVGDSICIS